ncbi:MAG: hypothetical protein FWD82_10090 [Defluviitaleaceae bacterium]|nr:hypothetical protein [Defluviitaleaceae bacterium]
MTELELKTGITDSECEFWDDYYTKAAFEPGMNLLKYGVKPGLARNTLLLNELDKDVIEYLRVQAKASNRSQTAVINDIVREKLAVGI